MSTNRRKIASTAKTAPDVVPPTRNRRNAIQPNKITNALMIVLRNIDLFQALNNVYAINLLAIDIQAR